MTLKWLLAVAIAALTGSAIFVVALLLVTAIVGAGNIGPVVFLLLLVLSVGLAAYLNRKRLRQANAPPTRKGPSGER